MRLAKRLAGVAMTRRADIGSPLRVSAPTRNTCHPRKPPPKEKVRPRRWPRLGILLFSVFVLFALLGANSAYLSSITFLEWFRGETYQNYFYQFMFLGHLVLGLLILLPVIFFGIFHIKTHGIGQQTRGLGWLCAIRYKPNFIV